jgi:hypothetical protein
MKLALLCSGLLFLATVSPGADGTLRLRVSSAVAIEPADIVVRTFAARNADNRAIQVVVDSSTFYSSSEVPLDGDRAPLSKEFRFREMPAGDYVVSATLIGPGGEPRATATDGLRVF